MCLNIIGLLSNFIELLLPSECVSHRIYKKKTQHQFCGPPLKPYCTTNQRLMYISSYISSHQVSITMTMIKTLAR